jgi:hypothetical protein
MNRARVRFHGRRRGNACRQMLCHLRCLADASWWILSPEFEARIVRFIARGVACFGFIWPATLVPPPCRASN